MLAVVRVHRAATVANAVVRAAVAKKESGSYS